MLVTTVDVIDPPAALPRLPVARAVWRPRPDLRRNATAWIIAGGSHHTSLAYALDWQHLADLAAMCGIERVRIDDTIDLEAFAERLRWNDVAYRIGDAH